MPPKYEYKTVMHPTALNTGDQAKYDVWVKDTDTVLNSCGNEGWELVSATVHQNKYQYFFKRELQQEQQVDETEVNTDEMFSAMNKLKVDAEPPAPTPVVFNFGTPAPTPGVFAFGTPAPTFEKPPEKPTADDAGTEVDILRRDLDDLRNDFDRVRRKLGKTLGIGFITKEEEFEDFKRPSDFRDGSGHNRQYPRSFKGMTSKDYRAWKSDFEAYHRQQQKNRETQKEQERSHGILSLEEEQIAKDRLEAELQRVLKVELEAENKAKLKAYSEAEADAKAQKKHYSETGEFISKGV